MTEEPTESTLSEELKELAEQATRRGMDRAAQEARKDRQALSTAAWSERHHRIVVIALGVVGVVVPLLLGGEALSPTALPVRIAAAALLLSAMILLAWDVVAPLRRERAEELLRDRSWAFMRLTVHREIYELAKHLGIPDGRGEVGMVRKIERELNAADQEALTAQNAEFAAVLKFDTWVRGTAYLFLLVGLSAIVIALLFAPPETTIRTGNVSGGAPVLP